MRIRSTFIALLALALTGIAGSPVSAASTTILVDDDGAGGGSGCNGIGEVPRQIGAALSLADPGDTIIVCPGVYREIVRVRVKGVVIQAATPWTASIAPRQPRGAPIVRITANDVTLFGMRIVAPTTGTCSEAAAGILVDAANNVEVNSNRVLAYAKGDTLAASCGLRDGIRVTNGALAVAVQNNLVRDFRRSGVEVSDGSFAKVLNNSIRYWHLGAACPAAACAAGRPAGGDEAVGVWMTRSGGQVSWNAITNGPDDTDTQHPLAAGIRISDSSNAKVRNNYIRQSTIGLDLLRADETEVQDNAIIGLARPTGTSAADVPQTVGLQVEETGRALISLNNVLRFDIGIRMGVTGGGNLLEFNDATGNGTDCVEASGAKRNSWNQIKGNTSSPAGLCRTAPVQELPDSPT